MKVNIENRPFFKNVILVLIAFIVGCASPHPNIDVVAQTLQAYQVGKTTFADFKKDTGLVMVERPATPAQQSYLNPPIFDQLRPKTQKVYGVPKGSPWKIYETAETTSLGHGTFSHTSKFVVGNISRPISILAFDKDGNLTSISPVP